MMRSLSFSSLALAAAAVTAFVNADTYYEGDGTAYTLGQPSSGNCNFMAYGVGAETKYAAINDPQWNDMLNCGRCAEVWCTDSSCADQSKSEVVYILDRCPECAEGDLDLSPTVFESITGSSPSRLTIKWKFVDCPVSGNIQYCLKSGSNAYWTAIQPANTVNGVSSMTINGATPGMVDSAYYFLLDGQSTTQTDLGAVTVSMTSSTGEVVTETVSLTSGSCTTGSKQFSGGEGSSSSTPTQTSSGGSSTTTTPTTTTPAPTTATPSLTTATPTVTPTPISQSSSTSSQAADNSEVENRSSTATSSSESSTVANDFDTLTDTSGDQPGTVNAADASGSVAVLGDGTSDVTSTTTASNESAGSGSSSEESVQNANTETADGSTGTSPVIIALIVLGGVGVVALAVVAAMATKKKLDDKRNDRNDALMARSFDNFNSPVRVTNSIAAF